MAETEQSDLDILMSMLEEIDAKEPGLWTNHDIDVIIAHQRRNRANREAGIKPRKPKAVGTVRLTLADLGYKKPPPSGPKLRRI